MPAPNDHSSEITDTDGGSQYEPLVDRQLELDLLRQHIARVADTRKGHAVLILGESGVGKSRLADEAAAEARRRGMTVISVQCLGRGAEPLLPLKEALASYLGRSPGQARPPLAGAGLPMLDAVPFLGTFLASIGKSSKARSASAGSTRNCRVSSSRPPPAMRACSCWSMTCTGRTRTRCIS